MPPSRSTLYRQKLKLKNPEKFEDYKKKQRQRAVENRAKLRAELAKRKPSQSSLDEIRKRREQGLVRQKKYLEKKAAAGQSAPLKVRLPFKQKTRTQTADLHEYWRKAQQKCRSKWTRQKKVCVRAKDRAYQQRRRDAQKPKECTKPGFCKNQSAYNATSKARKSLPNTPKKYATVVSSLIKRTTPRKRDELKRQNIGHHGKVGKSLFPKEFTHSLKRKEIKLKQMVASKLVKTASQRMIARELKMNRSAVKKVCSGQPRKPRKHKVDTAHVRKFFVREDVARPLPQKRFATKHGPGHIMQISLKSAFRLYKAENPAVTMAFSTFVKLRPKNVRLLSSNHRDFCLCVYCINIRYKVLAMNEAAGRHGRSDKKLGSEADVVDILLCRKSDGERFHQPDCIDSSCESCSDHASTLKSFYADLPQDIVISWNHWEKQVLPNGKERRLLVTKSDQLSVLLAEFIDDVTRPSQGMTFVRHITTAKWQYLQFNSIKDRLPKNTVLEVLDFAKNRNIFYQDEIKSAFFSSAMVTIHPIVAFYRKDDNIIRDSVIIISEDNQHDYHAVKHFCKLADTHIAKAMGGVPDKVIVFSDGCSAQYKSKGPFADLSLTQDVKVSRNYFGSEHGKGQSDGEIGVLNRAIDRAIIGRQVVINNAEQMFHWCEQNMTSDEPLSQRHFLFVRNGEICRDRPFTDVKCVQQTRKIHQAENIIGQPYTIKKRKLSCFCHHCIHGSGICSNQRYVGSFEVKKLTLLEPTLAVENSSDDATKGTDLLETLNIDDVDMDLNIDVDDDDILETPGLEQTLISGFKVGQFVMVQLEQPGKKTSVKNLKEFAAEILQITDNIMELKYLVKHPINDLFYWPDVDDVSWEPVSCILRALPNPEPVMDKRALFLCFP